MTTQRFSQLTPSVIVDDFELAGGPTLVDPPTFVAGRPVHGVLRPVDHAPANLISLAKPHAMAAIAAAHPGSFEVKPIQAATGATWPGVAVRPAIEAPNPHPEASGSQPAASGELDATTKWTRYDDARPATNRAGKLVVTTYRLLGFGILTGIVVVLVGYIATTVFYFASHSWIVPTVVSASDDKVVALRSALATHQNQRDRIADELAQTDLAVATERMFQLEFAKAIKSDLQTRSATLGRVRALAVAAATTRDEVHQANDDYAATSSDRMAKDYDANLIDRNALLAGNYQLAQITSSNLTLAERQAELETRAGELAVETRSLDAILADRGPTAAMSYDVLKIKRDYDASKLAVAKAVQNRTMLAASLARYDRIIAELRQSAYLRAIDDHAVVALVPYGNLEHAKRGTTLYGCRFGMVVCHEVGAVLEVLPGEVAFKHPHRDAELRGQLIELRLEDASAAEHDVLFVGGAPLWL